MKRTQLLVLSVLAFGLQGVAQASPYPADGEANYSLVAADSRAAALAAGVPDQRQSEGAKAARSLLEGRVHRAVRSA